MSRIKLFLIPIFILNLLFSLAPRSASARQVGEVLSSIPAPGPCITGLAWDGKNLWAVDHKTDLLYKIDEKTGKVLHTISSPGYRPAGLAWDGRHLWNADTLQNKLYRLNISSGLVEQTMDSPSAEPSALGWDGRDLWLASSSSKMLQRIDRQDGTNKDSHQPPGESIDGLTFDGRYLWLADRLSDKIYLLDPASGEVLFAVAAPGPYVTGLAFDGKNIWAADYQTDRIYRLSVEGNNKPIRRKIKTLDVEYTHQVRNLGPGTVTKADVYLAIPSADDEQDLNEQPRFSPAPQETLTDEWGQKIAHFVFAEMAGGKFPTVTMKTRLTMYDVQWQIYPHLVKALNTMPSMTRMFLTDGDKYLIKHPTIQKAVKEAMADEKNPYWMARRIYRYIHQKMFYKLEGGWNVAPRVLERGNGSCSEYSFVFIAMCRAAGIPARYVGSLVVRKDQASFDDIFHRWVEIYLPGYGWVPVDPSRGDKPNEAARADAFGHLEGDFLITTRGAGGSKYLSWRYNASENWVCRGRCQVDVESIAEWSPLAKADDKSPSGQPSSESTSAAGCR